MPGTVLRVITRLNRGGPLRQLCALVPGLAQAGWTGPVVTGRVERGESDGSADLEATGVEVIRLRPLQRGIDPSCDPRAFKSILAAVRRYRPDVVHTHLAKAGALGRVAARIAGVPAVHTVHGHHLESVAPKALAARLSERFLGRMSATVVALSARQARDLVDVHAVLPRDRVRVIPPGMDLEAFRRRAAQAPAVLPASEVPRFLWTGRYVTVKDPHLLVEAVAHARERFHVTMLGRGPLLKAVRATVRAHGLEDRISCPGSVRDVAPWLQAVDALVLCSRSEGAPLSVIEAMALGKPVVVTTVGGLPDMVEHEGTGLWVPPRAPLALAAALDRLAADAALRRRMGQVGARDVDARFGAARLVRETAALYEEVRERP